SGELEIVKYLISKGADIKVIRKGGWTVLHSAARGGNLEIVKLLITKGADIHAKIKNGSTVLHYAASGGNLEIVKYLIDQGADPRSKNMYGRTILHSAARGGNLDIVKYLIDKGVEINKKDKNDKTPLDMAKTREIKEFLTKQGRKSGSEIKDTEIQSSDPMTEPENKDSSKPKSTVDSTKPDTEKSEVPVVVYHRIQRGQTLRQIARFYYGDGRKVYLLRYFYNQRRQKAGQITIWAKPVPWQYDTKLWLAGTIIRIDKPVRVRNTDGQVFPGYQEKL
ncbi:MAG: ankyrin repeat domain-containing protein, partial [Spirochaetota bacterium]|nr:ankyrin repeat domain-containing protein [Spirochaetota bacterium]